jgi:hypothetical protein
MNREVKRQKETDPQPNDFLMLGRELQNKRGPPGSWASAERDFREFFGAGCVVVAILWRMLGEHDLIPEGGKLCTSFGRNISSVHIPRQVMHVQ